jgi:hypothetical protein
VPQFVEPADVAASVEQAFDYVTDQSKVAEWNEHVERAEVVGGGPVVVGTTLHQYRRRGSKEFVLTFHVSEHDRPRRHVVTGTVFGVDTKMGFDFVPQGTGTRVTMSGDVSGKGVRALLAPVVAKEMRKSVVVGLAELTRRLGA